MVSSDLPVARVPCGCGCSRAAPVAGGYRLSAGPRGRMPGETEGWGPGSWRGAWGPELSTSAAAEAGWPGGGPGLLPPLQQAGEKQCCHDNAEGFVRTWLLDVLG